MGESCRKKTDRSSKKVQRLGKNDVRANNGDGQAVLQTMLPVNDTNLNQLLRPTAISTRAGIQFPAISKSPSGG